MNENNIKIDGCDIFYCLKKGVLDCDHLLVVFSGFGMHGNFTYDFAGKSLEIIPSNILWIKDIYKGNACYYLGSKMDFSFEKAIVKLIDKICQDLNLNRDTVTLLGASKGGTASLYFGLKYNFKNIISSAPQIKIGSFVKKVHPDVYDHLIKSESDVEELDSLIDKNINALELDLNKNIYLFSSLVDEYETCEDLHKSLIKFKNFNHIQTDSQLVWQHNTITAYNIPLIISIICANSQGLSPSFGQDVINGNRQKSSYNIENVIREQRKRCEVIAELQSFRVDGDRIYPEGVAFVRGYEIQGYGTIKKKLILRDKRSSREYIFPIGSFLNKRFSKTYYSEVFIDYSAAGFTTMLRKGLNVSIPPSSYELFINLEVESVNVTVPLKCTRDFPVGILGSNLCRITCFNGNSYLQIIPPISEFKPDFYKLLESWQRKDRIHYRGYLGKYGMEVSSWGDLSVWLILHSQKKDYIFPYGKVDYPELNEYFNGFGSYSKSSFCSIGSRGVDISSIPNGEYEVFISILVNGSLISVKVENLNIC